MREDAMSMMVLMLAAGLVGVVVIVGVLALLLTGKKDEHPRDRD